MTIFGLIGRHIDYSFSRGFFSKKFETEQLNCHYRNFDLESIESFESIFETSDRIGGLNVTIPYKESVIPFLDDLDPDARTIGAVNTIKIENGKRIGYNTDHFGFQESIKPYLLPSHQKALILGTGGASKAVDFALNTLNIKSYFVSRNATSQAHFGYDNLTAEIISNHSIIVNCTPVGTYPNVEQFPAIPYQALTPSHLLYDLIYNPDETKFLRFGKEAGSKTLNGLKMLELQAEKSWAIWNS
jgi:shikimate dehydrogenase